MKRAAITIGLLFATMPSGSQALPIVPFQAAAYTDPQAVTRIYYYRPYYAGSYYYRPNYQSYYYNPYYIPYYYYGCRRFYSWGNLRCVW
jgi:hypothetical protein